MNDAHEVISAFLDDELFDPSELALALADPAGRALLIDLIALRHLVQPEAGISPHPVPRKWRSPLRAVMAAAAVLVALVGGYVAGERRAAVTAVDAPAPTRIVEPAPAWNEGPIGGAR
jgi:hypothetical protein